MWVSALLSRLDDSGGETVLLLAFEQRVIALNARLVLRVSFTRACQCVWLSLQTAKGKTLGARLGAFTACAVANLLQVHVEQS